MKRVPWGRNFRVKVHAHYKKLGRHTLPWRKNATPYCVFVSEYMLQQTSVERVTPKFIAFIKKFPNFKKLAEATLPDVFSLWQGLGYNRRAKYLRDAAGRIVQEKRGVLPNDAEYLESLPGIGPYSARAIQTFAFGSPEPFIETNIRTAITHHYFPRKEVVHDTDVLRILKGVAPRRGEAARVWYAGLMDYGAHLKRKGVRLNRKSAHYIKQKPFRGSRREMRGALMKTLLPFPGTDVTLARRLVKPRASVREELLRLKQEGLVVVGRKGVWKLAR